MYSLIHKVNVNGKELFVANDGTNMKIADADRDTLRKRLREDIGSAVIPLAVSAVIVLSAVLSIIHASNINVMDKPNLLGAAYMLLWFIVLPVFVVVIFFSIDNILNYCFNLFHKKTRVDSYMRRSEEYIHLLSVPRGFDMENQYKQRVSYLKSLSVEEFTEIVKNSLDTKDLVNQNTKIKEILKKNELMDSIRSELDSKLTNNREKLVKLGNMARKHQSKFESFINDEKKYEQDEEILELLSA